MSFCSNISSVVSNPPADLRSPSLGSVSPLYDLEDVEVPSVRYGVGRGGFSLTRPCPYMGPEGVCFG